MRLRRGKGAMHVGHLFICGLALVHRPPPKLALPCIVEQN